MLTTHGKASAIGISILLIIVIPIIRFLSISIIPLLYRITNRLYPLSKP